MTFRRAIAGVLCWLLGWQPAGAACSINGKIELLTTYSLVVPTRTTPAITTSASTVLILYASTIAQAVNSGGGDPIITSITGGGLTWASRFREHHAIGTCWQGGTCYVDVEVLWAVAASPLTQAFDVTIDSGLSAANIFVFGVDSLANPLAPWDTNVALPAKGVSYNGIGGTTDPIQVSGVSTSNADDVMLISCFSANVTSSNSCDQSVSNSGQGWGTGIENGYQQNIFTLFFNASGIWSKPVATVQTGLTLTPIIPTNPQTDWIAHADALECTGTAPPPGPNPPRRPFLHGWPW